MVRKLFVITFFALMLNACDLIFKEDVLEVDGQYSWVEAVDPEGHDLLKKQKYQSASFYKDGTYEILIDSTFTWGVYEVDEGNTLLRMDYSDVWEIIQCNDTLLKIKNINGDKQKWVLVKTTDVTH